MRFCLDLHIGKFLESSKVGSENKVHDLCSSSLLSEWEAEKPLPEDMTYLLPGVPRSQQE